MREFFLASSNSFICCFIYALFLTISSAYAESDLLIQDSKLRCGWFDNPTPGNAWLNDKDGEWEIAVQGGHHAKGKWPEFKDSQWVRMSSGSSGYGCTCMKVVENAEYKEIINIISAYVKSLSVCRHDKALKEPKNN